MAYRKQNSLTVDGVLYADANKVTSSTSAGTAGEVLTSNGAGVAPTYQPASASGSVTTLTGDTGGAVTPTAGNINILANLTAGSSLKFSGSGSTLSFNDTDANDSVIMGLGSGNGTITGTKNTGIGRSVLTALTSGDWNTSCGYQSLQNATDDRFNCAFGAQALQTLVGSDGHNTAIGIGSLQPLITGSDNVCVGYFSGFNYTGAESSNILIGAAVPGTTGESNVIRIGTTGSTVGLQNKCFIAGIASVSVSNLNLVTIDTITGQMGSQAASALGAITSITGNTGGAQVPLAGNFDILGTGSITVAGTANTETVQLTGLTNHAVLVGAGTDTITKVGPTATAGQVLQSAGSSADPAFSTATYPSTATGTGTILRADGTNWVATTSTYPNTNAVNTLLYASSANVMAALATANSGVLTTDSSGVPSIDTTNFAVLSTGVQMKGNNTNTAPPAGFIGEQIRSAIASGSAVSVPNGTPTNITSISLTAGIWDISCVLQFSAGSITGTLFGASISATSATIGTPGDNRIAIPTAPTASSGLGLSIPSFRATLSGTTTYYLVAEANYTVGSVTGFGRISATRVG